MITYIKKNIFKALEDNEIDVIGHVCNQKVGMSAGIARIIAKRYPGADIIDKKHIESKKCPLYDIVEVGDSKYILNIYAMIYPGNSHSNKGDRLEDRLRKLADCLNELIPKTKGARIGIPLVLSDKGRDFKLDKELSTLDYFKKHIEPLINHHNINVYYL